MILAQCAVASTGRACLIVLSAAVAIVGCGETDRITAFDDPSPPRFENVSSSLPLPVDQGDYGAFWADFDNDDRADLVFMGHGNPPLMLRQQDDGEFLDVSASSGLKSGDWEYPQQRDRHGGSCADVDKDGFSDLFITHGALRGETLGIKYDELLIGNGDFTFNDESRPAGSLNAFGRGRLGSWADVDNDGWLDLYVANFQSTNVLYRNNGDGGFTDVTASSGLGVEGFRASWSDFDQDGDVDVLLASPLRLFQNNGNGDFEDVTRQLRIEEDTFTYGLAWADLDGDGDQDFIISAQSLPVQAFMNRGDHFERLTNAPFAVSDGRRVTGIAPADIDNDGDIDLVSNTADGIQIHTNAGGMRYLLETISPRVVAQNDYRHGDIAIADYDNDGLLDIASDDPEGYQLFRNTSAGAGHWLRLVFKGVASDTLGFGNKVWVTVNDELVAFREYHGAIAGLRSFGCSPLQIGLGDHDQVDVRVLWPDGTESILADVAADQSIVVTQ